MKEKKKEPKAIAAPPPPKKKAVENKSKVKLTKKVLRKNQEQQDRLFNHVDMIMDM